MNRIDSVISGIAIGVAVTAAVVVGFEVLRDQKTVTAGECRAEGERAVLMSHVDARIHHLLVVRNAYARKLREPEVW